MLPPDLFAHVTKALAADPQGLSLAELQVALKGSVSRRSLQRRLDVWMRSGAIKTQGIRRGRRYFPAGNNTAPTAANAERPGRAPEPEAVTSSVPISAAGQQIQALVHRPIADRAPIGYQRDSLENYVPNETEYLPEKLKTHLRALGRTLDGHRPAGTYAREILNRLLIDLSWASSRLEGNTYSLLDTRELIEHGTAAPGKDAKETQMILNHKAAIELLVESAEEIGVNRYTITNLHALLADNLLEDSRNAGRLRTTSVAIGGTTYLPTAIPQLIEERFALLLNKAATIRDCFEQSFFLMAQLPYLQPFVDVNQRTSRLAANIPLIKSNLVPLSFIDVPDKPYIDGLIGVYELNRIELLRDVYLWAYERSVRRYKTVRDSLPEPDAFRLKYRNELAEIVRRLVREKLRPTEAELAQLAKSMVSPEDLKRFTSIALAELAGLHDGNIARFRLRPSEFKQWKEG
ncbi:MAG TPA: Fic family protein [Steroidobacteraceae bacterium]